jgi:CubicO group peptidase (beta-lactamase class C family)
MMTRTTALIPLFTLCLAAQPLPVSQPAELGFSPERLGRLHAYFERQVSEGKRAGAIILIVRNGKIADWQTFGYRDLEAKLPMEKDTICRIYSMSKLVTSVAALQLLEEGRFQLDDPAEKYLPELKGLKVFTGGTAEEPKLADPKGPVTIKHLLTHTSGMVYGSMGTTPVHEISRTVNPFQATTLKDFVERAVRIPLIAEPGEQFNYSISTDVLGALVERVSGLPFGQVLQQRIFDRLGMADTSFDPPPVKRSRVARIYRIGSQGKLEPVPEDKFHGLASGGGGLYSTIGDYARFAQMLQNGGELNGVRILGRKTVELMMANHLNGLARQTLPWSESDGFGLGGSVRIDLAKGSRLGSAGEFGWAGMATTYVRLDPQEKTIALMYAQYLPMDSRLFDDFSTLFYQALVN